MPKVPISNLDKKASPASIICMVRGFYCSANPGWSRKGNAISPEIVVLFAVLTTNGKGRHWKRITIALSKLIWHSWSTELIQLTRITIQGLYEVPSDMTLTINESPNESCFRICRPCEIWCFRKMMLKLFPDEANVCPLSTSYTHL